MDMLTKVCSGTYIEIVLPMVTDVMMMDTRDYDNLIATVTSVLPVLYITGV